MPDSRDVNALRKQGKIGEALVLARELMHEDGNNRWNIIEYGWALHAAIKDAKDHDLERAKQILDELNRLSIPDDGSNDILISCRERHNLIADPVYPLLQKAKAVSKAGKVSEALQLYRETVNHFPESGDACEGLAWELWKQLKALPLDAASEQNLSILREYGGLHHVEKPSDIHSRFLDEATKRVDKIQGYIQFIKWWDLENLRKEDYQKQHSADGENIYPSLTEKVIRALNQAEKKHDDTSDFKWISEFIRKNLERYPEQEWFQYYYGVALVNTGDLEEARKILFPIVRAKQSEFWVWHLIGKTFTDIDKQISCLCKALICRMKEDDAPMRWEVHYDLALLLKSNGNLPEAKKEINTAISLREKKKWSIPSQLERIQKEDWFRETGASDKNEELHKSLAIAADNLLLQDLPWLDAIVSGRLEAKEGKKELVFVGNLSGQSIEETAVNPSKYPEVSGLSLGSPIRIKTDQFGGKTIVVALERREGEEWDILPLIGGVISHINVGKSVSKVTTSKSNFCLLSHDKFPEAEQLSLGSFVDVKMRTDTKRNISHAIFFQVIDELPEGCDYYIDYDGFIGIGDGNAFGFVDDAYVSPALIKSLHLEDGDHIIGKAICEWNDKKMKSTWTVTSVDHIDHVQEDLRD